MEKRQPHIVIADVASIGEDIDLSFYSEIGRTDRYMDAVTQENAADRLRDADVLCINKTAITDQILNAAPKLKLICLFATGYDNTNAGLCRERGIAVANVPAYSTYSVVQHTFALYLSVAEHLRHYDDFVRSGAYASQSSFTLVDEPFHELEGLVWGVAGLGHIGRKVAEIAEMFGSHVIYYPTGGQAHDGHFQAVSFEHLLEESDVVSIHCPLNERTRGLFDAAAFRRMKKTAIVVNVARGAVICEDDLYHALKEGEIAGAGLDVLTHEPIEKDNPLLTLLDSGRLMITPHIAWAGVGARERCVRVVAENIRAFLQGKPQNIVNGWGET